jgi:hypothetical protein
MPGHGALRLQVECIEGVRAQVAEEDVGRGEELLEGVAVLGGTQVEDHAPLPPVVLGEGGVRKILADPQRSEGVAHGVARRGLDLDHVGAPVGQERRSGRCGNPHA